MSVMAQLVAEGAFEDPSWLSDLDEIRERARLRCIEESISRNLYVTDMLDNLHDYRDFLPDLDEIGCMLGPEEAGDWRSVLHVSARLATQHYLEYCAERDLEHLVQEAEDVGGRGLRVWTVLPEGGAYSLVGHDDVYVEFSDGSGAWLILLREPVDARMALSC